MHMQHNQRREQHTFDNASPSTSGNPANEHELLHNHIERQLNITHANDNMRTTTQHHMRTTTQHHTAERQPTPANCPRLECNDVPQNTTQANANTCKVCGPPVFVPDKFHCRPYAPNGQACTPAKLRSLRQRIELIGVPHKLMSPTCVAM